MSGDAELQAIGEMMKSLERVDAERRPFVVNYVVDRMKIELKPSSQTLRAEAAGREPRPMSGDRTPSASNYPALADAFTASGPPAQGTKRALVVAAHLQAVRELHERPQSLDVFPRDQELILQSLRDVAEHAIEMRLMGVMGVGSSRKKTEKVPLDPQ